MQKQKWYRQPIDQTLKLQQWYFDPIFLNTHHLTADKPALYVGNHTLYGLLDSPLLWQYLRDEHGIALRALGDKIHFKLPVWGKLLERYGAVQASPENCNELMRKGESILVFPGGAREVFKRKNEAYQLIWKQRTGFARMAIQHGYDIVPFAALGGDECFDIVLDADDILKNSTANWMMKTLKLEKKLRKGDMLPTLTTGIGKLPVPRPERLYFSFGERIPTQHLDLNKDNEWSIRETVADSIETQLMQLNEFRRHDREQNWVWWRKKLTHTQQK